MKKKAVSLLVLSLFFSLQVFQLCDESHDACEALSNGIEAISHKNLVYASPTPVDDPDASVPLVIGQTLTHGKIVSDGALIVRSFVSVSPTFVGKFISQIRVKDRSPPRSKTTGAIPLLASLLLACTPARILAPPLF